MGKNDDPQTGWIGRGSLRQTGCSFQVDKFQQLSTNQGLICIVSDVGVPKLVSAFLIIKGPHLGGGGGGGGVRANAFPIRGVQDLR